MCANLLVALQLLFYFSQQTEYFAITKLK